MHILIQTKNGKNYRIKKSDIRRIYSNSSDKTFICFNGNKNTPIQINDSVEDFFNLHLAK